MDEFEQLELLRAYIESRTGVRTYWLDQPEDYQPNAYVVLQFNNIVTRGQDGVRYEYDETRPPGQEMVPVVVGQREFTLRIEARAWTQELALTAETYLERLRLSFQLPSAQAVFALVNIGLVMATTILQANVPIDERMQSRAVMDVVFATTIELRDDGAEAGVGIIETVVYETTYEGGREGDIVVENVGGVPLPDP